MEAAFSKSKTFTVKEHEGGDLGNMRFSPPRVAHVVDDQGRVRQPRYAANLSSWMLEVRKSGVRLSQEAEKLGYAFLEDLFRVEGKLRNWQEYLRWWKHRVDTESPSKFPEALLPDEVRGRIKVAPQLNEYTVADPELLAEVHRVEAAKAAAEAEAKALAEAKQAKKR